MPLHWLMGLCALAMVSDPTRRIEASDASPTGHMILASDDSAWVSVGLPDQQPAPLPERAAFLPDESSPSDEAPRSIIPPPAAVKETLATQDAPVSGPPSRNNGLGSWTTDASIYLGKPRDGDNCRGTPTRWRLGGRHGPGLLRRGLHQTWLALGYLHYLNPLDLPDAPDRGIGSPLIGTGWLERPFYVGWFMGFAQGGSLINDWTRQGNGYLGGYRVGYDFDHYFGAEMRFAMASFAVYDSQRAIDAQMAMDAQQLPNLAPDDPFHDRFDRYRDNDVFLWDINLLFYPLGNAVWRPYLGIGIGAMSVHFTDRLTETHKRTLCAMPLSIGLKYYHSDRVALRLDLTDNLAFGAAEISMQNALSITVGMDFRFGGKRTVYWPYTSGTAWWL